MKLEFMLQLSERLREDVGVEWARSESEAFVSSGGSESDLDERREQTVHAALPLQVPALHRLD